MRVSHYDVAEGIGADFCAFCSDLGLVLGLSVAGGILTAVGIVVGMLLWRLKRVRDRRRFVLPMDGDAIVHSGVEADPLLLGDE